MNAEPHTHKVKIRREYGESGGHYVVTYGDTTITVRKWWWLPGCFWTSHPSETFIEKCVRWAIRKHDEGSRAAGREQVILDEITAKAEEWAAAAWDGGEGDGADGNG